MVLLKIDREFGLENLTPTYGTTISVRRHPLSVLLTVKNTAFGLLHENKQRKAGND